jgi:hypothetical protein
MNKSAGFGFSIRSKPNCGACVHAYPKNCRLFTKKHGHGGIDIGSYVHCIQAPTSARGDFLGAISLANTEPYMSGGWSLCCSDGKCAGERAGCMLWMYTNKDKCRILG